MSSCPVCGVEGDRPVPVAMETEPVRRCRECGARYVHPAPFPVRLRSRYDREHRRGSWKERFESQSEEEIQRRARLLSRLAGAPGTLLDVGCGDGRFMDVAADRGWTTVGLEISPAAAKLVSGRHAVLVGDLAAVDESLRFDAVTFWDVLEHVTDPADSLRRAVCRLKPEGVVAITMPNARGVTRALHGPNWQYYDFATYGHLHHLGPTHVRRLLESAGLDPVYSETRGSTDLRHIPEVRGWGRAGGSLGWLLDKASGLLARIAEPLELGNTLLVVGRKA